MKFETCIKNAFKDIADTHLNFQQALKKQSTNIFEVAQHSYISKRTRTGQVALLEIPWIYLPKVFSLVNIHFRFQRLGRKSVFKLKLTDEDLEKALDAVRNGMFYGKALQLFHIPKTTLHDRSKGKVEEE